MLIMIKEILRKLKKRTNLPVIIILGDSHVAAPKLAMKYRKERLEDCTFEFFRLLRKKGEKERGEVPLQEAISVVGQLESHDLVVSMVGGNQHAVYSTVQHEIPFDFHLPKQKSGVRSDSQEIIPFRMLKEVFQKGISEGHDGTVIASIRNATRARVIHMLPPPPKRDNDHIAQYHESHFAKVGIGDRGVTPPDLRLKFWKMQADILAEFCSEQSVELLWPLPETLDEDGFLLKEFYSSDATHANAAYGELMLQRFENIVSSEGPPQEDI
jgi:hypothetical protein